MRAKENVEKMSIININTELPRSKYTTDPPMFANTVFLVDVYCKWGEVGDGICLNICGAALAFSKRRVLAEED